MSDLDSWTREDEPDPRLQSISAQIYQLLADKEDGLDITQIRKALGVGETQEQLTRRVRDLRKYYVMPGGYVGNRYVYKLVGKRTDIGDGGAISGKLRAQVLHNAKGRCQQCGKTIADDHIKLQADHKIPQNWGGMTTLENLWALCESCNNGKKDLFASFDEDDMKEVLAFEGVHERIAHLLKRHIGKPVSSQLIEFVANATERQDDWHKRLRELRYPGIDLVIDMGRGKNELGHTESTYTLQNWKDLPPDYRQIMRAHEKSTKKANQSGD